jgi:hypothetical protein
MKNIETSDNFAKFGIVYNYHIVEKHDDLNGMVELAKLGGKRPKYATVGMLNGLRTELKNDMSELRTELKKDMSELKAELKSDMNALENRLMSAIESINVKLDKAID